MDHFCLKINLNVFGKIVSLLQFTPVKNHWFLWKENKADRFEDNFCIWIFNCIFLHTVVNYILICHLKYFNTSAVIFRYNMWNRNIQETWYSSQFLESTHFFFLKVIWKISQFMLYSQILHEYRILIFYQILVFWYNEESGYFQKLVF